MTDTTLSRPRKALGVPLLVAANAILAALVLALSAPAALADQSQAALLPNATPIADSSSGGEWVTDVERPVAQFRGRFQLRLAEARSLLR